MSPSREQPRSAEREMKCGSVLRGLGRPSPHPRVGVVKEVVGRTDKRYELRRDRTIANAAKSIICVSAAESARRVFFFS